MSDDKYGEGNGPPELLVDGSFEKGKVGANTWSHQASVGGWQSSSEIEVWGKGFYGLKATDGDKFVELDYDRRASNIFQDVKTASGAEYTFTFDYMKRPDSKAGSDTIQVYWNNELVGKVDPSKAEWSKASFKVVGTGGNDRIEFREEAGDNDSYGGLIDNASLRQSGPSFAEREAAEKARHEAEVKAEREAKDKADKEAKEKAEREAKDKADKEAKEKAEHEAKDKADKEAKEKAEREAKDKADKEAKEKAEHEAKDKADREAKEKAEHEAKDKADKEAKEKAEHEAKDKADKEAKNHHDDRNSDDDKHDGRRHGDGDHNDDGHCDNGRDQRDHRHGDHDRVKDALALETKDATDVQTGDVIDGNRNANDIVGGHGSDHIAGRGGNDVLVGDRDGAVTVPLDIKVGLTDADGSERLSIVVAGMPAGATLSAGHDNGDGTWSLRLADLPGLTVTSPDASDFTLTVTASTKGHSNLSATSQIHVTLLDGQDDVMQGNGGNDELFGDVGNDEMYGGSKPTGIVSTHVPTEADNDVLHGGAGNDKMWGNSGDDRLFGEADDDAVLGGKGNDLVDGGAGDDLLKGNTGNDELHDGAGNDVVEGNSGDDLVVAGEGDDSYAGGSGFDTIDFSGSKQGLSVDLSKHVADGMGLDTFSGFEKVVGSSFDDVMKGSKAADVLVGGAGDDVLRGLGGADVLTGGEGRDTFQWLAKDVANDKGKSLGVDVVTDFEKGDVLDFSKMFKSGSFERIEDVVKVVDDGKSSHVFAAVGGDWHEVVTLEGVTGLSAAAMHQDGMILV